MKFITFGLPLLIATTVHAADDIVIGDFEASNFGTWQTTGTAFGSAPVRGATVIAQEIGGARGDGVASSEVLGDVPKGTLTSPPFQLNRKYLSFAISGGNYERRTAFHLLINGQIVRSATGHNSDVLMPKSWDISRWKGQTARVQAVDEASGSWGHINVDHILQTDKPERMPVTTQPLYQEMHRPQFHFTARQWEVERLNPGMRQDGWLNDLNGLVYYEGEYHLFAQRWNKCWVHAVSRNLVHWTELKPAFWEEELDSGVQSGNCVIDVNNSSGLSKDPKTPPMIAFWSRNDNRSHCISYSLDKGRTWTHYAKNPILVFPERDPMVFWHAATSKWVMMLYGNDRYHVFTSNNLLDWKDEKQPIGNSFECPDFFELPIDNDPNNTRWVLVRGDGKYSLGRFDGVSYREETEQFISDSGPHFYATQSWGNVPNGRRIQAAWMRGGAYPDMPFNQQVSFPCELTLRTTPEGIRMFREPIREIANLHDKETRWENRTLQAGQTLDLKPSGELFHLKMQVAIPAGATLTLNVRGVPLKFTQKTIENGTQPLNVRGELQTVEILIDRTSIEAFANRGEVASSRCYLPSGNGLSLQASGGAVNVKSLSLFPLKSIWESQKGK